MRSSTSFWLFGAALTCLVTQVAAVPCGAGTSRDTSGNCEYCAPGFYQTQTNPNPNTPCQQAQEGTYACGPETGVAGSCYGAPNQTPCPSGTYQPARGQTSCITCPKGYRCPGTGQTQPQQCSPGKYMPREGSGDNDCDLCPPGTFNNAHAAFACCNCCAGWFQDQPGQTFCRNCFTSTGNSFSSPGSDHCEVNAISEVTNANTCPSTAYNTPGTAQCPPEQGNSQPPASLINRRRSHTKICAPGLTACAVFAGRGGFECLDTRTDPENCGGCVDPDNTNAPGSGRDCTAIKGVSMVNCVKSKCVVDTCQKGFVPAADGSHCVPVTPALKTVNQPAPKKRSRRHV